MDYLRNRPFLVIEYSYRPQQGQNPGAKNFAKDGAWDVTEKPSVVKRITNKILNEAHTIIDLQNKKIIKTRYDKETQESIYNHFYEKYKKEIDQVLGSYQSVQFTGNSSRYSELENIKEEAPDKKEESI